MNACYLIDFIHEIYRCLLQKWDPRVRTKNGSMCHTKLFCLVKPSEEKRKKDH